MRLWAMIRFTPDITAGHVVISWRHTMRAPLHPLYVKGPAVLSGLRPLQSPEERGQAGEDVPMVVRRPGRCLRSGWPTGCTRTSNRPKPEGRRAARCPAAGSDDSVVNATSGQCRSGDRLRIDRRSLNAGPSTEITGSSASSRGRTVVASSAVLGSGSRTRAGLAEAPQPAPCHAAARLHQRQARGKDGEGWRLLGASSPAPVTASGGMPALLRRAPRGGHTGGKASCFAPERRETGRSPSAAWQDRAPGRVGEACHRRRRGAEMLARCRHHAFDGGRPLASPVRNALSGRNTCRTTAAWRVGRIQMRPPRCSTMVRGVESAC